MKKWLALVVVVLVLALGWFAAGPFIAINGIRSAIQDQDAARLSEYVNFPAVRISLKQQVDDYIVRRAGEDVQSSLLGPIALRLASGASSGIVDAIATPAGLAAVMEGRNFWQRVNGDRASEDSYVTTRPRDPLEGAKYRYESLSRFTATVNDADGEPVVFVLTRQGVIWKVTEVRVPFLAPPTSAGP